LFPVYTLYHWLLIHNAQFSDPRRHALTCEILCISSLKKLLGFCKMNCIVLNMEIPCLVNPKLDL